jgi:chemotaxis protein MotB
MGKRGAVIGVRTALCVAGVVLGTGCVSVGKYDDLKKQYDDSQAKLGETGTALTAEQQKNADLAQEIADKQSALEALNNDKTALEAEVKRLDGEQKRLTEELAALMKDRSRLKESTDQLREALAELARRKAEADRRVAQFRNLLAKFKAMIDSGKLEVKMVDGRMVLRLPTDVLFDSGSASLSKAGAAAVAEVAAVLATLDEKRFQVEGHTDNVPITTRFPSNWELSAARAVGVVKAMLAAGMQGGSLSAAGFGEYRPVGPNDSDVNKAKNRRIEIVLVPDLSNLPGFEELQQVVEAK